MAAHAATIVATNYLAFARVLAESFLGHHPGGRFTCLVVDDPDSTVVDGATELFDVLHPADIGIEERELQIMAGIYDVTELSTALKPDLLRSLLVTTGEPLLYLDPDIEVHDPLDDLLQLSAEHGITVTPHVLRPIPDDGLRPSAADILAAGIYNLGYLGVGPAAVEDGFFDFWSGQLRRHAISDPAAQLFTDQRWIDFVDCFDHLVVRDPGCNLAYWNAWAYDLDEHDGAVTVDGHPLRFYHFSGFDPAKPWLLSKYHEPPRLRLGEQPVLRRLCQRYAERLWAAGHAEARRQPYRWSRSAGLRLDQTARRLWREAVLDAERAWTAPPPGPFDGDGGVAYLAWLQERLPHGGTRYLDARARDWPDLAEPLRFLHSSTPDLLEARETAHAVVDSLVPPRLAPAVEPRAPRHLPGLNIIGYLRAEAGVGEAARLVAHAASAAGMPFALRDVDRIGSSRAHHLVAWGTPGSPYDANLLCINADQAAAVRDLIGAEQFERPRRTAGLWFWETQRLPAPMHHAFDLVDEVWAASQFIADALIPDAPVPVERVVLPVDVPSRPTALRRDDVGLPPGFVVLYVFSFYGVMERKNPAGAIEAFTRAFDVGEGAHLVIKTVGGDVHWRELERLRALVADRDDVHVIDGDLRATELRAMIELCDCYLSLHRSEGLGLTMAEAMARARPVIATGWSGNLDLMDEHTAHLLPYELVPIPDDCHPYAGSGRWADPDVDAAAEALRRVRDDPFGARALGQRARDHLLATRSREVAGRSVLARFESLRPRPVPA